LHQDRVEAGSIADFWKEAAYDKSNVVIGIRERETLLLHSPRVERDYRFLELMYLSQEPERTLGEGIVQEALFASRTIDFRFSPDYSRSWD
jgi:hypothetical protein